MSPDEQSNGRPRQNGPGSKKVRIPVNTSRRADRPAAAVPNEDDLMPEIDEVVEAAPVEPTPTETAVEMNEWKDRYLRLAADMDNTKKRLERYYANLTEQQKDRLLLDLLPVIDNLERALWHASSGADEMGLRDGVELTLKLFLDTLAKYGVDVIDPQGEPFDPELHEAIAVLPNPELPPHTVAAVELKGYQVGDRLLRAARVLVTPG